MEKKSPEKCSINPSIFHRNKMGATWFSHSELFMPVFSFFSGIFSRTADKIKPCCYVSMSYIFYGTFYFPFNSIYRMQWLKSHSINFHKYEGESVRKEKGGTSYYMS